DSNICRAAVHDGRLGWWNLKSSRIVHIQRNPGVFSYLGSIRNSIRSESYGVLRYKYGCYRFTNPRIAEKMVDLTILTRPVLYTSMDTAIIECHQEAQEKDLQLTCGIHANSTRQLLGESMIEVPRPRFEVKLLPTTEWNRTAAYFCALKNSLMSQVLTVLMRTDAYFVPKAITQTVSIGSQNVILSVSTQFALPGNPVIQWYKDGDILSTRIGHQLVIPEVQLGHAGVYSIVYSSDDARLDKSALLRLIVRACVENKFGPTCGQRCPVCLNGGICHDMTGECVCPPGFYGLACEKSCDFNRFGRNCTARCSDKDLADGCAGALLCLPDPFGCTCAAGFTGLNCNSYCQSGHYGAGCSQVCGSCSGGSPCDRFSGICSRGCEPGWKGPRCTITLPRLRVPPTLLEATSESLSIAWVAWDPATDPGDGHAVAYYIQYKERGKLDWKQESFPGHVLHGSFNYTIKSLNPETDYHIRVAVIDQSGIIAKDNAPIANFSTVCESPLEFPRGLKTDNAHPHELVISWKVPPLMSWRCREITYTIRYRRKGEDGWRRVTDLVEPHFTIESPPFTLWIFQLRSENLAGASNWSAEIKSKTGQDAPGPVTSLQAVEVASASFEMLWQEPSTVNGLIAHYEIKVDLVEILSCKHLNLSSTSTTRKEITIFHTNATGLSIKISGLKPYTRYNVSVTPWTVVPGQLTSKIIVTLPHVPTVSPHNLRVWYSYETELGFIWSAPHCEEINGQLIAYMCVLEGLDAWVKDGEHRYIVEHKTTSVEGNLTADGLIWIKLLKPYSNYFLMVYSGTSIGFSQISSNISARTKASVPPPPANLTLYGKTWTSISFLWAPPYPPHGELEFFHVFIDPCPGVLNPPCDVRVGTQTSLCSHPLRRGLHCFTWSNLTPNTTYNLWVTAKNLDVKSLSDPSEHLSIETFENSDFFFVPGPPLYIRYKNIDLETIWIRWGAPLISEGAILHYRVNYTVMEVISNDSQVEFRQSLQIASDKHDWRLRNLIPEMRYKISVEAHTSAGYGEAVWIEAVTQLPRRVAGSLNTDASDQQYTNSSNPFLKNDNPYHFHGYPDDKLDDNGEDQEFGHITEKESDSTVFMIGIVGTVASILILFILVILILYLIKRNL
uniref:Tyrosine-protein kinase receptor n=1 Tax=Strigamia maritima TaxID=126957 RepID=T1IXJ0_STRMM